MEIGMQLMDSWIALLKESKGSVYKSPEWAKSLEMDGKKPTLIVIEESGQLKASLLAFEQEIITPLGKKKILFSEGTPLFKDEQSGLEILSKFRQESKKYFYGLIRPTVINQKKDIFEKAGYKTVSDSTILVSLEKDKEFLWNSLEKKSARWGVKTAEKNNLEFQELKTESEISEFYKLYKKTAHDGGFKEKSPDFLKELTKSRERARLFLIKKENKIIAGGIILIDNDYTILNLTAASDEGYKLQAMPFFYWNLILFSKSLGKAYFDLGGYDKNARQGEKIYNINKFKENFGGNIVEQLHCSTNSKYTLIRSLMKRFKIIKRFYKKK